MTREEVIANLTRLAKQIDFDTWESTAAAIEDLQAAIALLRQDGQRQTSEIPAASKAREP